MPTFTRRDLLRTGLAVSASTLVTGPLGRANALLSGYPLCALQETSHSIAPREHLLFDFGWKFFRDMAPIPRRDLGFGMGQGDFAKSASSNFPPRSLTTRNGAL